jgi:hypothetical protein
MLNHLFRYTFVYILCCAVFGLKVDFVCFQVLPKEETSAANKSVQHMWQKTDNKSAAKTVTIISKMICVATALF